MGLILSQHAESTASLQAQSSDSPHHFQNAIELRPLRHVTPCRTHAKASDSMVPRPGRRRDRLFQAQERLSDDASAVVPGLRAVLAVFWAAASFDAQERAPLHLLCGMITPVRLLRFKDQIGNRLQV